MGFTWEHGKRIGYNAAYREQGGYTDMYANLLGINAGKGALDQAAHMKCYIWQYKYGSFDLLTSHF